MVSNESSVSQSGYYVLLALIGAMFIAGCTVSDKEEPIQDSLVWISSPQDVSSYNRPACRQRFYRYPFTDDLPDRLTKQALESQSTLQWDTLQGD